MNASNKKEIIAALNKIAPLELSEEWDNTGLLIDSTKNKPIQSILLTIDLTAAVLEEAIANDIKFIIAYHPPLFNPVDQLSEEDPKTALLLRAIENGIMIYSPHTALDNVDGGVNDWLLSALPAGSPIESETTNSGRAIQFDQASTLEKLIPKIKQHLNIEQLRIATTNDLDTEIQTAACCAGSGFDSLSIFQVDLWLTGEMKHHDILHAQSRGISVILAEHTRTERGYLPLLKNKLASALGDDIDIRVAKNDRCPIREI